MVLYWRYFGVIFTLIMHQIVLTISPCLSTMLLAQTMLKIVGHD